MLRHAISRRELLGMGLGAAAGMIALPHLLEAHTLDWTRASAPIDCVDAALKAARWIRRSRIETKNGVTWPANPLKPASVGLDLYDGMPGVITFYLELFYATGDRTWLDDAQLGANELAAQLPTLQAASNCGLYTGLAGAGFVLEETHRATGDGRYRDASTQALRMIHQLAQKTSSGARWAGASASNDIVSGSAGIGLFLIYAANVMDDVPSRALGLLTGQHLIAAGVHAKSGTKWPIADGDTTFYPNFEHGTSGVGFYLAKLFANSFDRSMYSGSLTAERYLDAVAAKEDGGFKVFHHEPGGEKRYDMGWANGPAGTHRIYAQLSQVARREHWTGLVEQCAQAVISSATPANQSTPAWASPSQRNGLAGIGEFFVALQRTMPKPAYADMIQRVSSAALAQATVDGDGLKWMETADPEAPDAGAAHTGFMHGAAGIGTYFLHADALANGRKPAIHWPDTPTTGPCEIPPEAQRGRDMSTLPGGPVPLC